MSRDWTKKELKAVSKACGCRESIGKDVIVMMLTRTLECRRCKATITPKMIYVAYRVVKQPDETGKSQHIGVIARDVCWAGADAPAFYFLYKSHAFCK